MCLAAGGFLWWVASQAGGSHPVILRLRYGDTEERIAACQALGQMDWKEVKAALPDLVRALGDQDPVVRREVVDTLTRISVRSEFVISSLLGALKDEDDLVRAKTALALGMLGSGNPIVVPAMEDALKDSNPDVREAALAALSELEPERLHHE